MRGLPKFLLPAGPDYLSLIEMHVSSLLEHCDIVWIPTRPEQTVLLETLGISNNRVVVVPMVTETMTETVIRISGISVATQFLMVMPDTFFSGEQPFEFLAKGESEMQVACWRIRQSQIGKLGQVKLSGLPEGQILDSRDKDPTCVYEHSWGAMSFRREVLRFASPEMPHTGFLLPELISKGIEVRGREMSGLYYDCGTPSEYVQMLQSETRETY